MKCVTAVLLTSLSLGALAAGPQPDLPSCDLAQQRQIVGQPGGEISDPRHAHIAMRANILQADIGNLRRAQRLTHEQADVLWKQVDAIRQQSAGFVKQQGFLSAAERASQDRTFDEIARVMCPGIEG
jgi:hypothetical protein